MLVVLLALQASPASPSALIDELSSCRAVAAEQARLACYDRVATAVIDARRRKDIVVLDRADVQKTKRSLFGFSLPSIKLFGDGADDAQLKQLVGTLQSSTPQPGGLMRFTIENGGTWEGTEQFRSPPRRGDVVTIKAGPLGSYIATAPGRSSARVRRLR